jgi:N-acyl-D-amino-acid deacylase
VRAASRLVALASLLAGCQALKAPEPGPPAVLIQNVRIIDGTGAPEYHGSLRMAGGVILEVGDLIPATEETILDGGGLVLAPGFIDTHSHHDPLGPEEQRAEAPISQGVTTIVIGQDGGSRSPLSEFFEELEQRPSTVNTASYAGHSYARRAVLGDDYAREATAEEVEAMKAVVAADMEAGALGLSTGLEYSSATKSSTEEVIALAQVAADHGGRYISHMRSEDSGFWESVEELILIGERTGMPVQISHVKLAMVSNWGASNRLITRLDEARAAGVDVTADIYPYTFWGSTIRVFFPDLDYDSLERATFAVSEVSTPDGIRLSSWGPDPSLKGRTLAEIAADRGREPAVVLMELVAELGAYEDSVAEGEARSSYITAVSMTDDDIEALLRWPHTNVCSDGGSSGGHPRGYGAFPRYFARFVRERNSLDLPAAVYRVTGLSADHMGITSRGRLQPGLAADLVLFDPATIEDRATVEEPKLKSTGIEMVWVNGELVYSGGRVTEQRPGVVVRRGE